MINVSYLFVAGTEGGTIVVASGPDVLLRVRQYTRTPEIAKLEPRCAGNTYFNYNRNLFKGDRWLHAACASKRRIF